MKVTVLMPAYNAARHIPEAIQSVLAQSHADFELLVINDGSTDETPTILEECARQDPRIRILSQENRGMAESLNRALMETQAEWVFRMDADDIMLPERLQRQIAFIQANPEVKVASCLAQYISETGKKLGKSTSELMTVEKFHWYVQHHEAIGLLHPGVVMHRETVLSVGGYRGQFWPADDIDLWNRLAEKGHVILVQNEVLMLYRVHTGSVSTAKYANARLKYEWVRACMNARRSGEEEPDWDTFLQRWKQAAWWVRLNRVRKSNAKAYYHAAGHDYLSGHFGTGMGKLFLAALLQPAYVLPRLAKQIVK